MGKRGKLHGKRRCFGSASVHTRTTDLVNEDNTPSEVFVRDSLHCYKHYWSGLAGKFVQQPFQKFR